MVLHNRQEADWCLWSVLLSLTKSDRRSCLHLLLWLAFHFTIHSASTYLTVIFLSSASINVLLLLLISKSIDSLVVLGVRSAQKSFVLTFINRLHTLIYTRLLSTDWYRLKLVDHEEIRHKVDEACSAIQCIIEEIIEKFDDIWDLMMAVITIAILCPWPATISLVVAYISFFFIYARRRVLELLALRVATTEGYEDLNVKYLRAANRSLDYVLHRERDVFVTITGNLKMAKERLYYVVQHAFDQFSFTEQLLGKTCIFVIIGAFVNTTTSPLVVIPLYYYLSSFIDQLDNTVQLSISCIRLSKDYDLIQPMLDEYKARFEASQFEMKKCVTIQALRFTYEEKIKKRGRFTLELCEPVTFQMGDVILVTGNSGAGKSTFYDIVSGCISQQLYTARVTIDEGIELPDAFHNLESSRTFVLQDAQMDYHSSVYTIITDFEDDCQTVDLSKEEERVWRFLRLLEIDTFVQESLGGQLHLLVENQLSGGQKTRLLLARALNRAEQRQSRLLILDEPDRGLPSETTFRIMKNIVQWFRPKGILLLTLHNDRVRERLPFHQVLHIERGRIRTVPPNVLQKDTTA